MTWPPTLFWKIFENEIRALFGAPIKKFYLLFKNLLRYIIGEAYTEERYFQSSFARFHAGFGGHARVVTIVDDIEKPYCGPGQSLLPSVTFHAGELTCDQYLRLMGTF